MSDLLTKAITKDGFFKISVVTSTETAEKARKYHNTTPVVTAALGRLLSVGLIMGAELKEENSKLTVSMKGDGQIGTLLVTANSKHEVKGYAENPLVDIPLKQNGKLDVGGAIGKGYLSVIKDIGLKEPYMGQVAIQSGEIGDDIAYYYLQSEQVPSFVSVGVLVDTDCSVKYSGGLVIQVMPGCDEESVIKLENSVSNMMSMTEMMSNGMDGKEIIKYTMLGFDTEIVEETEVAYVCDCSEERMRNALISLGKKELDDIIADTGEAEIICSFCNKAYKFDSAQLSEMSNKAKQ